MKKIRLLTAILLLCPNAWTLTAQENRGEIIVTDILASDIVESADAPQDDSVAKRNHVFRRIGNYFKESNTDKTMTKGFDFSIIGGPHYSNDVKFGIGLVAAGLYRTDRSDPLTPVSNVSLYGDIATSGFYLIGIRGNTFFSKAKYRLDYKLSFFSMPTYFWGIGYDMGRDDGNKSKFTRKQTSFNVDFMYSVFRNGYIGATVNFNYIKGKDFARPELLMGQKHEYTNGGAGLFILYDSRDVITAPQRGWFFKLENVMFPSFAGSSPGFNRTEFTLDYYHRAWEGAVLAYDLHAMYNKGDTPWTMLARMGGSHRMRGYYEGRYRDKGIVEAQVEIRQKVWRRIGVTAWGGAGNIFNNVSRIHLDKTLHNYGVGFRWEFKNRVNVRLDYGIGKGESGFMFNINEAF